MVAGSSLVVGCFLALSVGLSRRALGLVRAFGSGVRISDVAYELLGVFTTLGFALAFAISALE